jgi:two-component system, chemotaxis family, protein-glutamate methylesterase/glutaminase
VLNDRIAVPTRDIIVIGASAGGVEALSRLASALPANLPASVLLVLHVAPTAPSLLPAILDRAGPLKSLHAGNDAPLRQGVIYIAPPDRHLILVDGRVRTTRGPKENSHRPAVDVLFRSAAVAAGRRVIGVVLSGNMDDGTAGMAAIHRLGGTTIVQNPKEAVFPGMPLSAIQNVEVDHVLYIHEIAQALAQLTTLPLPEQAPIPIPETLRAEVEIAQMEPAALQTHVRPGEPSQFTCPDCQGTLFELHEGNLVRFRCRVGHAYTWETLLAEQGSALESTLWAAMVALREKSAMCERMMRFMRERGMDSSALRYEQESKDASQRAREIQHILDASRSTGTEVADDNSEGSMVEGEPKQT